MKTISEDKIKFSIGFSLKTKNIDFRWHPIVIFDNWKDTLYALICPIKIEEEKQ